MKTIDPKTTRRRITMKEWTKNSALYATYKLIGNEQSPQGMMCVIEKKPEFLQPRVASLLKQHAAHT